MIRDNCGLEAWSDAQDAALTAALNASIALNPPKPPTAGFRLMAGRREAERLAGLLDDARHSLRHAQRYEARAAELGLPPYAPGRGPAFEAQRRLDAAGAALDAALAIVRDAFAAARPMEQAA